MKNTLNSIAVLILFFLSACGSGPEESTPAFECSSPTIKGVAPAGEELKKRGVFEIAYDIHPLGDTLSLDLLDTAGEIMTSVQVDVMMNSLVESETTMVMRDASQNIVLTETSHVRFMPGLGSRIETTRTVDGSTLYIRNLLTNDPRIGSLDVSADANSLTQDTVFRVYDPLTQEFASQQNLDAWAETVELTQTISGEWQTLKKNLFKDSTWRTHAMAHLATCLTGEQVNPATFRGLDTVDESDDAATVQQAISCDDADRAKRNSAHLSKTLDRLDMITGSIGDVTIKGFLVAHAHEVGLGGIKLPGLGTIHIKPSDIAALAGVIDALGKAGAVGIIVTNPAGLLLAGIGATAYIAARVNDAFGEDILRAYYEDREAAAAATKNASLKKAQKKQAQTHHDPHLLTFDGLAYDFMTQGDFVLVHSESDEPLDIHVRQAPGDSKCPHVTYNWGVATQVGSQRISAYADDPVGSVRVDGEPIIMPVDNALFLDNGALIYAETERRIVLVYPTGDVLEYVRTKDTRLDIYVTLAEFRMGSVGGLLGNFNGVSGDDIQLRNGRTFDSPVTWDQLNLDFRDSWLVNDSETLLDYGAGESPADFFNVHMPRRPFGLQDIEPIEAQRVVSVCEDAGVDPSLIENCAVDAYCSSDASALEVHVGARPAEEQFVVERPIFLDGWAQQGRPANGEWMVDESGRSVTQTINGEPTFFVSPQNMIDKTIRGQFSTSDFDDDYLGFVIGYEGPLESGSEDDFKTLLFQWKGRTQDGANAGFTLARVDGIITDFDPGFWRNINSAEYQVIATNHGEGKSWNTNVEYQFEVSYEKNRLQIAINNQRIFDVAAADAGLSEFPSGRFGFYNFSQPAVTYSDFSISNGGKELGLKNFNLENFDAYLGDLKLIGDAKIVNQSLLLTDGTGSQSGGVWHRSKVGITGGFSTEFTFRIEDDIPDSGRGIAFIIQNADLPLFAAGDGSQPGALGYSGIPHSIAVEFDAFQDADEPSGSHVAVHTAYDLDNSAESATSLGLSSVHDIDDGRLHWARIEYRSNGELDVYLDDSSSPVLSVPVDLSMFRFDNGHAYIGIAGQARGRSVQAIHSWSYLNTL